MLWGELIRHAHGYHDDEEEEAGLQDPELVSPAPGPAPCCRPRPPVTSLLLPLPSGSLDGRAAAAPGGGAWPRLRPLLRILINLFIPNKGGGGATAGSAPTGLGASEVNCGAGGGGYGVCQASKGHEIPQIAPKPPQKELRTLQITPNHPKDTPRAL